MDPSFQSEDELFSAVLELPEGARARFLDSQCEGNPKLRAQVESLLRSIDEAEAFLDMSPVGQSPQLFSAILQRASETSDGMIGPYKLCERIGEGGCGVVYLAEQLHPIRRSVALKVIKQGMDTEAVIARFEAERQALALMEHPHIARVYDAGVTPKGRPYFAMELVRGERVTDYCDKNKLTVEERVRLFISICQAVQHAHLKGIIHRDLKPSNILIAVHDGTPIPKLIDFGIAKATQGHLTDFTLLTSLEQFVGTPAYTSPEQFGANARSVDTRSDIYSLGVVLYELLTGTPPFGRKDRDSLPLDALIRQIRDEDPPRPSTQIGRNDIAQYSPLSPNKKLIKQLRGDLDWIVLHCLEKEPANRYQSTHELVSDLHRFLLNEPLVNRPSDLWRTVRRVVQKHRTGAALSLALLVTLVAATAISSNQTIHARRAERKALEAEKKAKAEVEANQAVLEFLKTDLLDFSTPEKQPDGKLKLRTLVDNAQKKVEEGRFKNQPLIENEVRAILADAYNSLGLYSEATAERERVVAFNQSHFREDVPESLKSSMKLVNAFRKTTRFKEGETLALHILPLIERCFGPDAPETAYILLELVWIDIYQMKFNSIVPLAERAVAIRKRVYGPEASTTLEAAYVLSLIYFEQNQLVVAEKMLRELREAALRTVGPESAVTLSTSSCLSLLYLENDQIELAEPLVNQIYEVYLRRWGPTNGETLLARLHIGYLAEKRMQLKEAETIFDAVREATQSKTYITKYRNEAHLALAELYVFQGRTKEARVLLDTVKADLTAAEIKILEYATWEKVVRAELELKEGNFKAAEALTELKKGEVPAPFDHPCFLLDCNSIYGRALLAEGKYPEAEREFRHLLAEEERFEPLIIWDAESARFLLAQTLLRQNRIPEARGLLEKSRISLQAARTQIPPYRQSLSGDVEFQLAALSGATTQSGLR